MSDRMNDQSENKTQDKAGDIICGKNSVLEVLRAGKPVNKVLLAKGQDKGFLHQVQALCRAKGVPCQEIERQRLVEIAGDDHRGVVALVAPYKYAEISDILTLARERNEDPLIVILAEVEDPHNLGAVLRTAECVGAHGVIIPKRRAAAVTETVAKVSAGALAYIPVARVTNLVQAMEELKEAGLWIAGAHMTDATSLWETDLKGSLALVLGSEGQGIPRLIAEKCDFMVSVPMQGHITSLNVSASAAVLLYEVIRQRQFK